MTNPNTGLQKAIDKAGSKRALAHLIGVKAQAIQQWEMVPPLRVLDVEKATGVSRYELRPDLYPKERERRN